MADGTVVASFAELKDALENTAETLVYLSADIYGEAGGIKIPSTKPDVIIDGTYEGIKHRYRDYGSGTGLGSQADTIMVNLPAGGAFTVTMQNMYIDSVNYYGPMSSPLTNANYRNVTYIMRGVSYHGPQVAYIGYGCVEYYDSDFFVDGETFSTCEEFAQCNRVVFGGKITVKHLPRAAVNMFPFEGEAATRAITITAGADVQIDTTRIFFSGGTTPFTIEDGASLQITSTTTLAPAGIYAAPFTIGKNATFRYLQTAKNGSTCTIYCNGDFTVAEGAHVYLEAQHDASNALIRFYSTSARLSIAEPASFVLRSTAAGAVYFPFATRLELRGEQINYWSDPPSAEDPGGFSDTPAYSWRKAVATGTVVPAYINGSTTNAVFTPDADGTNLTEEELQGRPLSALLLNKAYVLAVGSLHLAADVITDDNYPIEGTAAPGAALRVSYTAEGTVYALQGTADENGVFSIATAVPVPTGAPVSFRANLPFLLSEASRSAVEPGELVLETPPNEMVFSIKNRVSVNPVLFGRSENDWSLLVTDTRARKTPWRIYATLKGDLTSVAGHTLPEAVVYRDEENARHILSGQPEQVWLDESGAASVVVGWAADKGILLQPGTKPMYQNERYAAAIGWQLSQ